MTIKVRKGRRADTAYLIALHEASFSDEGWRPRDLEEAFTARGVFVLFAEHPPSMPPVGYLIYRIAADECEILSIGVKPTARRDGVGAVLLDNMVSLIIQAGIKTVFLEVGVDNAPARRLYEKCGFVETGRRVGYYKNGGDALIMKKNLSTSTFDVVSAG